MTKKSGRARGLLRAGVLMCLGALLAATPAGAQGTSVLTGSVVDAATKKPVADVVVTATSPALQGEEVAVTDASGLYRLPQLPPGEYTVRFDREGYQPYARTGIFLRLETTVRLSVELLPEGLQEEITVVAQAPTVDVGSSTVGANVNTDFARRISMAAPGGRGSSVRSFESLSEVAPGAQRDTYGVSINGTSSPENGFVVDGLSVGDPAFGVLGTQLSVEFIQEFNVITGGFMPEYGRATGGVLTAVTKSGSNEFHGSVFGTYSPGALTGAKISSIRERAIGTELSLWNQGDMGVELGGPILKDKLWFFAGVVTGLNRQQVERTFYREQDGVATAIDGTRRSWFADQRAYQYIGKLTYNFNPNHSVALSVYGAPYSSGGDNRFGFDAEDGQPEVRSMMGSYQALAHRYSNDARDVALKLTSSFMDKRLLLDANVGWHHQDNSLLPSDGSALGSDTGLAGIPRFNFRRRVPHSITEFEALGDPSVCDPGDPNAETLCPVPTYAFGGAGRLNDDVLDRYQAKVMGTYLFQALGHHVFKAGLDVDRTETSGRVAFTGRVTYRESRNGRFWQDHRSMGYMVGPDQAEVVNLWRTASSSNAIGAFLQDSWSILDKVTLNAGVRYDIQTLYGGDGRVAVAMPNQLSPRVGVVYDFTQQGRSKLFANYARYYQNTLMETVNAQFPGERRLQSFRHRTATANRPGCDPLRQAAPYTECRDPANLVTLAPEGQGFTNAADPNSFWLPIRGDNTAVDPDLKPQSSDEFVLGGEYQVMADTRVGATYTRRRMNSIIEDMSNDEATSFFLGNPGEGIASAFPRAVRDYDAVTLFLDKRFSMKWLGQVSYTWSRSRGNYTGLFRPESGQLAPNITSDFDLASLLQNRLGPLPNDHTHWLKAYLARDFELGGGAALNMGLAYRGRSGAPLSVLGTHYLYGDGAVYILPRGEGGRLPWTHEFDLKAGVSYPVGKGLTASLSADVFNLFNFQQEVARDQRYTLDEVPPIIGGTQADLENLTDIRGDPVDVNPTYGNTTLRQQPRTVRISARLSF
jgi:outer membrane receptor protein involved in Fe transport